MFYHGAGAMTSVSNGETPGTTQFKICLFWENPLCDRESSVTVVRIYSQWTGLMIHSGSRSHRPKGTPSGEALRIYAVCAVWIGCDRLGSIDMIQICWWLGRLKFANATSRPSTFGKIETQRVRAKALPIHVSWGLSILYMGLCTNAKNVPQQDKTKDAMQDYASKHKFYRTICHLFLDESCILTCCPNDPVLLHKNWSKEVSK